MKFTISNGMVCQNAEELLCTVVELMESVFTNANNNLIITNENYVPMTVFDFYTEAEDYAVLSDFIGEDYATFIERMNEPIDD